MRAAWSLFRKELREARWKWIISLLLLALTASSLPLMYSPLRGIIGDLQIPAPWAKSINRQMEDYHLYIWLNWYGKNLYQFIIVTACIFGAAPLTAERSRGSAELLLAQPLSRRCIFAVKYSAGLLVLWMVIAISTLVIVPASMLAGLSLDASLFVRGLPVNLAAALFFYTITWVVSIRLEDTLMAALTGGLISFLLVAAGWIPVLGRFSILKCLAAESTMSGGPVAWKAVIGFVLLAGLGSLAAYRLFERENF